MPQAPETEALLRELCGPTLCSEEELQTWIKATAVVVRTFGQELALLRGLLHDAEDEEPTTEVRGKMEALIQQIDAQTRILGIIAVEARSLRASRRLLAEQLKDFRELAKGAGYDA